MSGTALSMLVVLAGIALMAWALLRLGVLHTSAPATGPGPAGAS